MIPEITVTLQTGGLGAVGGSTDGIAALVIGCDPGSSGITAGDKFVLNSVDDAIANKLDEIDYAYQQIKEFYNEAGTGAKLYVLIVANTVTLTQMSDKTLTHAKTLLDYAQGEINILGVCRKPAAGYSPTVTNGVDADVYAALVKMQALAEDFHTAFKPFVGIVEGRAFQGSAATLTDLSAASYNFCGVTLAMSDELKAIDATAASVGLLLGRAAAVPVQRKVARVKDGALSIVEAWYGHATTPTKAENTDFTSIDAKGFITIGTFANKTGYYFMDDILATATTDDYKTISLRRTMNKMVRLVYQAYINELNDDIELTSDGKLSPATAKYYQGLIENSVNNLMTSSGELTSFSAYVDINQNVLSTGKIQIRCSAVPKGYSQEISVLLGFFNPNLA